jgi:hypothetical protein
MEENCEMIWKIWKKAKLNSDKIGKIRKKSKLNSEKDMENMEENSKLECETIWKVWKKCEMIWQILKTIVKRYGKYGKKVN